MKMFGSYKAKCLNSIEILEVSIKVSQKFTLPFTPYPLFQWSLQSKEILSNLGMKC
jgi:hypothetical protein